MPSGENRMDTAFLRAGGKANGACDLSRASFAVGSGRMCCGLDPRLFLERKINPAECFGTLSNQRRERGPGMVVMA